jgi:8-oxo-dGTP pyrophosphatase MutT (NUDIX family)
MADSDMRPVVPRPAGTVIVPRACPDGIELFMVRRDPNSRFAADAFVFPGGTVDPDDYITGADPSLAGATVEEAHRRLAERGGDAPAEPTLSLALHLAAVRELFEEAGILLADGADGPIDVAVPSEASALDRDRRRLQAGSVAFSTFLAERRLTAATRRLIYFSHWITPAASPRRYDTRFFVCELPDGQEATHCGLETVDGIWIAPKQAIERHDRGTMVLVSVTRDHLERLARFPTVPALLEYASRKPIRTVNPRRHDGAWNNGLDEW